MLSDETQEQQKSFQPGTPTRTNAKRNLRTRTISKSVEKNVGRKTTVSNHSATCRLRADPTGSESPNPGTITAVDSKVITAKDPKATNDYAPPITSAQEKKFCYLN